MMVLLLLQAAAADRSAPAGVISKEEFGATNVVPLTQAQSQAIATLLGVRKQLEDDDVGHSPRSPPTMYM